MGIDSLLEKCCVEIGITVSGASSLAIPIQFYRKSEDNAVEEQLALVRDDSLRDQLFFGVVRRITKLEPLVRDRVRNPFVDRPEIMDQSMLMPFTNGMVRLYGMITPSGLSTEVSHVATPGSKVFLVRDGTVLNDYLKVSAGINVGSHKYSNWSIKLDHYFVNYHIGVFGATGVGKSRLIRGLIGELRRAGYRVVVFDHSGVDYVPFMKEHVISSKEIKISPPTIASVIASKARLGWQSYGEYIEVATITYTMQDEGKKKQTLLLDPQPSREIKWNKASFTRHLVEKMRGVGARESSVEKAKLFIEYFIDDSFFDELNRRVVEPSDVVKRAIEGGIAAIDLSADTDLTVKQAIIADVIDSAWEMVKRGSIKMPANLVFVIDEAQNYVPEDEWTICKDSIETTVREGRKWGLSLLLASQRIARDIKSSIRANLGTVFFSRLSAQADLKEIGAYLDIADISEATLSQLGTREFFVAGLMNPLRKPLLLKVREVD
ncbi:MAG: ATP-binding protein [Thermocladium sp.]